MMHAYLSRYTPRYLRSITYMLQASEYHIGEYLAWFHRTQDFLHVEKRKQLVWTGKARAVFTLLALLAAVVAGLMVYTAFTLPFVALLTFLLYPYLVAYGAAVVVLALSVVQIPLERRAMKSAKEKLHAHPGKKIAIAGSYGKTTMREVLRAVLSAGKRVAAPGGSINTPLGVSTFVSKLTGDEEVLIFECGEYYPGDVRMLAEMLAPDIGVITGVNEAHLEKFKTVDRAADTIFELKDFFAGRAVYINGENKIARARAKVVDITYTAEGAGAVRVLSAKTGLTGTDLTLSIGSETVAVHSGLLGLHQVGPIAAAADIALSLGLGVSDIKKGIESTHAFEHRMAPRVENGITYIDDSYNGNPDGVRVLLAFLSGLGGTRVWYVTPGLVEMGAQSKDVHREIGAGLVSAKVHAVVLIKNSVTPHIEAGLKEAGFTGQIYWFDDALVAYRSLPQLTLPGDTVVLQNDWPDQYA